MKQRRCECGQPAEYVSIFHNGEAKAPRTKCADCYERQVGREVRRRAAARREDAEVHWTLFGHQPRSRNRSRTKSFDAGGA